MRSINWKWIFWISLISSLALFFMAHIGIAVATGRMSVGVLIPFTAAIALLAGIFLGMRIMDDRVSEVTERLNEATRELRETREAFGVYEFKG